jgi:acyl-CoA thioester hydrolase
MAGGYLKTFQVREYECDAYGHLNNANYVRYLHETTLEALSEMGALPPGDGLSKRVWYPKELFVEYLQPAYYGDRLQVQARPVTQETRHLVWAYEFRKDGVEEALASAQLAYGMIDPREGNWLPVLQGIPGVSDGMQPPDVDFPSLPPPPPGGAFTRPWLVQWRDVSRDGMVQVGAYLDYLLDFVLQAAAACGWSTQRAIEEGYGAVVRRKWLKIFRPVHYEEDLQLSTWLSQIRRSSVTRHFTIERLPGGERIGEAHTLWVSVDIQTGRPVRIPESWERDFKSQISFE